MKKFWFVIKATSNCGGNGFTRFHSRLEAEKEARRKATTNPGVGYVILETVGYVEAPLPALTIENMEA